MQPADSARVGYVVKRYPRYSETFIVNEILAHERAGLALRIFALRPPADSHFQDVIARVRAPVEYLSSPGRASEFWGLLESAASELPALWPKLTEAEGEDVRTVYQAVRLALSARRHGVCHLHAHFATSAVSVARLAARFAGIPYSFTAHAKDIFHETVEPADLRRKLDSAASVVTVSDYNLAYLRRRYDVAAGRVRRIYNGLDLSRFPYTSPDDRPPRIVSVGRLVEKKGFGDLIDACALLAAEGRSFSCRIVGSGALEAALRRRIEDRGVGDRVALAGPRPQREVIEEIRRAAVFAAPCVVGGDGNRDGLPTVLLEAMALGTPCVSTDVTGIPEVVRDGETGLRVPQRAPEELARALARLLDESELRVRLARRARRLIEAEFDIDRNAAGLRDHFTGFASSAGAAQRVELREAC